MDTPAQPADAATQPRPTWRHWLGLTARGACAGLLLALGAEAGRVLVGSNFHTIQPGQFYRCSQPSPERLREFIHAHGIRTVVNLRGCCSSFDWYLGECRASASLDACQEDVCLSAGRLPAPAELRRLVEVIDRSERPLLFHCRRGADRTGLASVVALLLYGDLPYDEARPQLGPRYGHLRLGRQASLDYFFDLYQEWLGREGLGHSRDNFRRFALHDYCPGEYRADIEPLDMPSDISPGEPFPARVRVSNTSVKPWHLRPGTTSGIHAKFLVRDAQGFWVSERMGQAGLLDAVVAPGESIDLTLVVPAPRRLGRYTLTVDLRDEPVCDFFQTGSEPLEWDFEVRE
jgi:hypothetical protein